VIKRGYPNAGGLLQLNVPVAEIRMNAFVAALQERDIKTELLRVKKSPAPWLHNGMSQAEELCLNEWLKKLPKPVAVFCFSKPQANAIVMKCLKEGIRIPSEIGVIGAGRGTSSYPEFLAITRIESPLYEMGFHAGAELKKMIADGDYQPELRIFQPRPLVACESTDIYGASDALVAGSIQYIRDHITDPLTTADLLAQVHVSRSIFCRRFKEATGRTPREEIHYWKIDAAKKMLAKGNASVGQIADRLGYSDQHKFSRFFKIQTGLAPLNWRKQNTDKSESQTMPRRSGA
jgi:LacI family transcriptional regulator